MPIPGAPTASPASPPWYATPANPSQASQDLIDFSGGKLPDTPTELSALTAWATAEGGSFNNPDQFNYWNTTLPEQGSYGTNSANVQRYSSLDSGLSAMMSMLQQPNMAQIYQGLQSGNPEAGLATGLSSDPWGTSASAYASDLAGLGSNPTEQQAIAAALSGAAGPGIASDQLGLATAMQQVGLSGATAALGAGNAQSTYNYDVAGALLGEQGITLQSQELGSQSQTASQQQALEQAQYGLNQQQYPEQQTELNSQYGTQLTGTIGNAAASGASNAPGTTQALGNLAQSYQYGSADIYRAQQLSQLAQQSELAGYQGQQGQFSNAQQQLGLAAQQQGLDVGQYQQQLAYGLSQLGMTGDQNVLTAITQAASSGADISSSIAAMLSAGSVLGGMGSLSISSLLGQ